MYMFPTFKSQCGGGSGGAGTLAAGVPAQSLQITIRNQPFFIYCRAVGNMFECLPLGWFPARLSRHVPVPYLEKSDRRVVFRPLVSVAFSPPLMFCSYVRRHNGLRAREQWRHRNVRPLSGGPASVQSRFCAARCSFKCIGHKTQIRQKKDGVGACRRWLARTPVRSILTHLCPIIDGRLPPWLLVQYVHRFL